LEQSFEFRTNHEHHGPDKSNSIPKQKNISGIARAAPHDFARGNCAFRANAGCLFLHGSAPTYAAKARVVGGNGVLE